MSTSAKSTLSTDVNDHDHFNLEEQLDLGEMSDTYFGRLVIAARREYFTNGGRVLNDEELAREVAERRGGTHLLDIQ